MEKFCDFIIASEGSYQHYVSLVNVSKVLSTNVAKQQHLKKHGMVQFEKIEKWFDKYHGRRKISLALARIVDSATSQQPNILTDKKTTLLTLILLEEDNQTVHYESIRIQPVLQQLLGLPCLLLFSL